MDVAANTMKVVNSMFAIENAILNRHEKSNKHLNFKMNEHHDKIDEHD